MSRREARVQALHRALAAASPLLGLACGGESSHPPEPVAVVGATLIDGTDRGPVEDAVVLMRGGRFECVGDRETCPVPSDARVVDGRGQWASPAFIDTHVHLWWLQDSAWTAKAQTLRLAAGITTVREMSSADQLSAILRASREAKESRYPGPRIFTSGRVAAGAEARTDAAYYGDLAAELIDRGVDGLKLKGELPREGLARALEVAERRGYDMYGHAPDVAGSVDELVDAFQLGLDGVTHVLQLAVFMQRPEGPQGGIPPGRPEWIYLWQNIDPELEERLITAMLADDVWLEPTLVGTYLQVNPQSFGDAPDLRYLPPEMASALNGDTLPPDSHEAAVESLQRMSDLVRRFKARGGTVVAGSDQLDLPAFALHQEMALLVDAGLSPREALRAATSDAARVLRWDDWLGTIEVGKSGDMVLLGADPLADIRNTRQVRLVFKGGVAYDPGELEAALAPGAP